MPTLRCLKGDRAALRDLRIKEGRKEKDVVHDALSFYSKSKEHKSKAKEHKDFVKAREREDKAKADAKKKTDKTKRDAKSRAASNKALGR